MVTNETSESQPQPQPPDSIQASRAFEMELDPFVTDQDPNPLLDWGSFLDFNVEDHITFPFDSDHHFPMPVTPPVLDSSIENQNGGGSDSNSDRIRKRDPRLVCDNYLAGIVPCACPEMDAMLEEKDEEEGGHGNKKARTARAPAGTAWCQVPGCEADIKELKGYHRRHRVCLKCANASEVLIHEQSKRYCQQCGKFHVLSDFDEGKRSCRRKLERHNNRRRRKSVGAKSSNEKEPQVDLLTEEISSDFEGEKDKLCLSNHLAEKDSLFESENGRVSTLVSAPDSKNVQGDSVVSFLATTSESPTNGGNDSLKYAISSSHSDNKAGYSSTCPTGRISFKLYDWNPAEFPRRLRHQIFEWLSSMPVELEGYIRPGCTILTAFIAMPKAMWAKLLENPASYLHDFIVAPGMLLSGKGSVLVYINDMIFFIVKDGISLKKVKKEARAPKIHFVHPICFEAGKPMKFVTCGSNLFQSKFRFLVSFSGKYLKNEYCITPPHSKSDQYSASSFDHQLCETYVPHAEANLFGPAFVEVENESGLSNFVPILICNKKVCSEIEKIQQSFDASIDPKETHFAGNSCEAFASRRTKLSELILDIAWLLKKPVSDNIQNRLTPPLQIHRYNNLLNFLISNDSITILEKVLPSLKNLMDKVENLTDIKLFQKRVIHAEHILCERIKKREDCVLRSASVPTTVELSPSFSDDHRMLPIVPVSNQILHDIDTRSEGRDMTAPLLNRDVIMNVRHTKEEYPRQSCSRVFSNTNSVLGSRSTVFLIAFALVCFVVCAILLHPHKVGKFVVSIRQCVNNDP